MSWSYHADKRNIWKKHLMSALMREVSALSGARPAEPEAQVVWVGELAEDRSPAAADRSVADEVIYGGQVLIRPNIGRVIGVR